MADEGVLVNETISYPGNSSVAANGVENSLPPAEALREAAERALRTAIFAMVNYFSYCGYNTPIDGKLHHSCFAGEVQTNLWY